MRQRLEADAEDHPGDDEGVDTRDVERIAAHQQRVEREHLPDLLVFDVFRDQPVDCPVTLQLHHRRDDLEHVFDLPERHVRQRLEADAEDRLALREKPFIATHVVRRKPRDLAFHRLRVAGIVERRAVVKADAVVGVDRPQVDLVVETPATQAPEFFEQKRRGDDGRAGIEGEAVLPKDTRPPARLRQSIDDRHAETAHAQADGRRQPAEARPDDDGMRRLRPGNDRLGACVKTGILPRYQFIDPGQSTPRFFSKCIHKENDG